MAVAHDECAGSAGAPRTERREIPLLWDGRPLPAAAPLTLWRFDPLTLTVAPHTSKPSNQS